MQVKQYFLILLCCLSSAATFACMCLPAVERLERDLKKEYAYIARLQVKELAPHPSGIASKYIFTFDLVEQLHGEAINHLAVQSYHPDFQEGLEKTSSSCDFLVQPGVEYFFFAREFQGELITGFCDIISMERNGVEHRGFGSAYALLNGTRDFFNIKQKPPLQNGVHQSFYPSGQLKHKAKYKNAQLQGKSVWWKPNGEKYIVERFQSGQFNGKQQRLATNDNYCIKYRRGKRIGKAKYFGRSKKEKFKEEYYSPEGVLQKMLQFDENGKVRREVIYDLQTGKSTERYFQDGVLLQEEE